MGGLKSFFKPPKPPPPPVLPPPPTEADVDQDALTEERTRRQRASGRQSNIVSSLRGSVEDAQSGTRISKLLG
jgi:hypothetical protein